ncbi:hypothetical protein ACIO7M_32770 [Streptomyces toxytricini]|uniref:Secreted protein n=1 Tax=Streptomyces toxytricini TaxID=67369 RepID=A0ABW8ERV4_STRT5
MWLAMCALAALSCILLLVGLLAVMTLRRIDERDIPQALLGLSHIISAMGGLLPWGKPTPPPALPETPTTAPEPTATPAGAATAVLIREQSAAPVIVLREPR